MRLNFLARQSRKQPAKLRYSLRDSKSFLPLGNRSGFPLFPILEVAVPLLEENRVRATVVSADQRVARATIAHNTLRADSFSPPCVENTDSLTKGPVQA